MYEISTEYIEDTISIRHSTNRHKLYITVSTISAADHISTYKRKAQLVLSHRIKANNEGRSGYFIKNN